MLCFFSYFLQDSKLAAILFNPKTRTFGEPHEVNDVGGAIAVRKQECKDAAHSASRIRRHRDLLTRGASLSN